jgi:hypothetical protein
MELSVALRVVTVLLENNRLEQSREVQRSEQASERLQVGGYSVELS